MEKVYAVIDIKSFYASCECAERGLDPFSTPLVVADPERTDSTIVMSATPYLKERYGCPNVCRVRELPDIPGLILAKPRMKHYLEVSAQVVSVFLDFVDEEDLHVYSVDESFLNLGPYLKLYSCSPEELVARIQKRLKDELGLIATAGIAPNMFLAKVCLDNEGKKKPPFRARWSEKDVQGKLWAIRPITKIWGISTGISTRLARMGIHTMKGVALADPFLLKKEFGVIGEELRRLANGIDETDIRQKYVPKERHLTCGQTLMRDYDAKGAKLLLREMTDELCFRLRSRGCKAGRVALFCGYSAEACAPGFSRSRSLDLSTDDNDDLYRVVRDLFEENARALPIRNLSVSFSALSPYVGQQYSLLEDPEETEEKRKLHIALDEIRLRHGKDAALRATSLSEDSTIRLRHRQIGGHNA